MKLWKVGAALAAGLLVLLAAFGAGRYSAPAKVEHKVEEKVVFKDRVVEKIVEVEKRVEIKVAVTKWREIETKRPDGTVVTEREMDNTTKTDTNTDTARNTDRTKETSGTSTRKETTVTTYARPQWAAGADLGPNVPALFGRPHPQVVPGLPSWLDGGLSLERRVLGPAWLGVRLGTAGSVQVRVRLEF